MKINREHIVNCLARTLPGEEAHKLMMPESRNLSPKSNGALTDAGVLIPIYPKNDGLYTVFMKRVEYNGAHSGQISFPGGKFEQVDNNFRETALREANEEVGIIADQIIHISPLSALTIPVSLFKVHPFVGLLNGQPKFKLDKSEVQYVIEAPVDYLLSPQSRLTTTMHLRGKNFEVPYFNVNDEIVWGATAMILSEFLSLLQTEML